jgi:class 3 adenylate cyclase
LTCTSCRTENPEGANFCVECGSPLAAACTACAAELPAGAKFCPGCGAPTATPDRDPRDYTPKHLARKILTQKSTIEGERKRVTVLFADVKGSMDIQERIDPEEWHAVMDRFFQIMADGVHRFEGTVNQYTGDGIMALFGAPIAHEDDAQRACYAALQMREAIQEYVRDLKREKGLQFSTRFGINSGEVVVGRIGDDLRMDYTAQGHTVGLAARMEALASPDTIYLGHATADLATGYFEIEDLGEFQVRGSSDPLRVFELRGVGKLRTRFDVSRARGLSCFVGRQDEMKVLTRALEHARGGQGQVVGVMAHAGVGKSRLCFEFLEGCRAKGMFVTEGRGVPHGKNLSLLPMMEAFRAYFGIGEGDDGRTVREKIAGRLLLIDEQFREVLPLVFEFFGAPDPDRPARIDPDARRRLMVGVLRRVVQTEEWDEPRITLLEDLHWFDEGSEAFLHEYVDALSGARNLLVLNFRPEYRADWMQSSHYQQISLQPLGPDAIRELLGDLLGRDPSIEGLAELIHANTRGNPFFTEEVVRSLIENGNLRGERGAYRLVTPIDELRVPASVHAVLAARIDRLAEREKQLLQKAAVIGKTFEETLLAAVAELPESALMDALAALRSSEFVYEESLYPAVEYAFRHPLTQEVALKSQLLERRRRLHAAVAAAIEDVKREKLDEQAALLAHHWEQAGEALVAARWAKRAAGVVASRDPVECVRLWQLVRELARRENGSEEAGRLRMEACREILVGGSWRIGMPEEEVEALFEEGRALGEACGDRHYLAALEVAHVPAVGLVYGDVARYASDAVRALPLIQEDGDPELLTVMGVGLSYSHLLIGRPVDALAYAQLCVELGEKNPELGKDSVGFSGYLFGQMQVPIAEAYGGDIPNGLRRLYQVIRAAREAGETEIVGWSSCNAVELLTLHAGELGEAPALARESLEGSERVGSPFSQVHSLARGVALVKLFEGDCEGAIAAFERALAIARDHRTGLEQEPYILALLARAQLGAGDGEWAATTAAEALAMARQRGSRWAELEALANCARASLANGRAESAGEIAERVEQMASLAEESGMRLYTPQAVELRARLAELRGEEAEREHQLREAHQIYAEIGATGHARRLATELGE